MRYCLFLTLIVLSLTFVAGCGNAPNSSEGEHITHASETLPTPEPLPFAFDPDSITKVTIYGGDDQLIAELTDSEKLNSLAGILDNARSFSEPYPFDLSSKIAIESQDGTKRELIVTGNGHVFVDQTAKIAYELDKQKFEEFVAGLKTTGVKHFEPGIAFDFPQGADPDEEAVISLVKLTMEAMVNKDKNAFRATLEFPHKNYLDFLIDLPRQYRFTEVEMIEPYDESNGRKNIRIRFEYEEDGTVNDSGYTFTSRKDKESTWKIANID